MACAGVVCAGVDGDGGGVGGALFRGERGRDVSD